jgi:hypothetical protein
MKRDQVRKSESHQPTGQVEDDNLDRSGWHALGVSADYYEQRHKSRIKFSKGDWWIAVGLYLLFVGVAFVIL